MNLFTKIVLSLFWPINLLEAHNSIEYKSELSFGTAYHGEVAKADGFIKNKGIENLHILRIQTSCGCTSIKLDKKEIKVNERIPLIFEVDTLQKVGTIRKSAKVYLKNHSKPLSLIIKGEVIHHPNGHMAKNTGSHIFSESCAACHVAPTVGKKGQGLYLSACAMCHGTLKQGASAPPLNKELYQPSWDKIIISGGNTMPGFAKTNKGPLDKGQISSLLAHLKGEDSNTQAFQSKSPALLFYRWCASCHGSYKMGPIGPDIRRHNLKHWTHETLFNQLKKGSSPSMPSFHIDNQGPFDDKDISGLVQYLLGPKANK